MCIRDRVMRAGIQLSRSSKRAATRPKYKYFWFLYPSIESIVLAVLYRIAPIGPPRIKKNNGAIIPSTVFSAMVSTVARVISLSSNSSVSRPTIQDNRLRASKILSCLINWLIVKPAPASERGDIEMCIRDSYRNDHIFCKYRIGFCISHWFFVNLKTYAMTSTCLVYTSRCV